MLDSVWHDSVEYFRARTPVELAEVETARQALNAVSAELSETATDRDAVIVERDALKAKLKAAEKRIARAEQAAEKDAAKAQDRHEKLTFAAKDLAGRPHGSLAYKRAMTRLQKLTS